MLQQNPIRRTYKGYPLNTKSNEKCDKDSPGYNRRCMTLPAADDGVEVENQRAGPLLFALCSSVPPPCDQWNHKSTFRQNGRNMFSITPGLVLLCEISITDNRRGAPQSRTICLGMPFCPPSQTFPPIVHPMHTIGHRSFQQSLQRK